MIQTLSRVFSEGFRAFFLAATLFGALAVAYWETWIGIHAFGGMVTRHPFAQAPHLWHAHEMIFGYACAAMAGFFLTAVPNWTGTAAARQGFVATAVAIWMAGRLTIWLSGSLPPVLVAAVDLAFLPVLAAKILSQLLNRPKPQNLMFLGLLSLLWASNLTVHLDWMGQGGPGAGTGLRAGLFSLCAVIAVLGGRVTPAFTRNAMTKSGRTTHLPRTRTSLDAIGIGSAILLPLALLLGAPEGWIAPMAIIAGAAQLARLAGWRSLWTLTQPILWSLHLAFAMLGLGYLALGFAAAGYGSEVAALHLLGIGAVGGKTLAVMSRAILGHTGRALVAPLPLVAGFALMALAALVRWTGSGLLADQYFAAILISGAAWVLAMALFVATLLPALLGPRLPG